MALHVLQPVVAEKLLTPEWYALSFAPFGIALVASSSPAAGHPIEHSTGVLARIAAGHFDQLNGSDLDATADLDALRAGADQAADALKLRIIQP